jgi:hypothetical protein
VLIFLHVYNKARTACVTPVPGLGSCDMLVVHTSCAKTLLRAVVAFISYRFLHASGPVTLL